MAAHFWVGDFFVDLSRNQITQKMQSQTIPPKALAVLTCLAKNVNNVVSHDELLSEVWPDTVVTPNTLQRSIAQLRKALGEDSQYQSYIKTHAKQGYSLECEVKWQDDSQPDWQIAAELLSETDINNSIAKDSAQDISQVPNVTPPNIDSSNSSKSIISRSRLITIFTAIIILGGAGFKFLSPTQVIDLSSGELRSLTATDNKEYGGRYTPDGQYVVFNRYYERLCVNNLWAKNLKTQQETQLTKNLGSYNVHSFSKDGKELVFIATENCNKPVTQKKCYKLVTLNFEEALASPQSPKVLLECKNSRIARPIWLNNNNIALLQKVSNQWKLASYSIADNKSTVIYEREDGNILDYDYSVSDDLIALTSIHNDGRYYIEILKPDGRVVSSHQIEYPPEISNFRLIYPNFTPNSELLIFSTGRQLFTLSYEGKITNISLPLDEPVGSPIFHPDGKRMLMTKGNWDSDIATIARSQIRKTHSNQSQSRESINYSIIERSTRAEDDPIYHPTNDLIAFKSTRSGESQVWITHGNGMDWAADGQSVLVNANGKLTQVYLDSTQESFPFSHRVEQLFQWNSEDNTALLTARINGILTFGELNLNNSEFRVTTEETVNWALKSEDGRLIYTDQMDRFWQPGPAEHQLIEALESQGSDKRFIIKHNVIYGINEEFQLWSYDLKEDKFEILGDVPMNTDYLSDINQTDILLALRITAKKELTELILAD